MYEPDCQETAEKIRRNLTSELARNYLAEFFNQDTKMPAHDVDDNDMRLPTHLFLKDSIELLEDDTRYLSGFEFELERRRHWNLALQMLNGMVPELSATSSCAVTWAEHNAEIVKEEHRMAEYEERLREKAERVAKDEAERAQQAMAAEGGRAERPKEAEEERIERAMMAEEDELGVDEVEKMWQWAGELIREDDEELEEQLKREEEEEEEGEEEGEEGEEGE
ncbi:hypothetical protein EJ06DRAFT_518595 [Trichodelitschia bisporula]|uniref:Uncharacterized protein n=1 Tax=Trichodelitschia bisporula TaxID=703511 RepID=A0A6G1I7Q5_9PEZI|nr:hypothetical protein EJ06DRAFT_518595 [Trichodelitschia bisporula]